MNTLCRFGNYLVDFIFPKTASIHEIESMSAGALMNLLPKARETEDERMAVLFDYKDPVVREMVWELKYKGNKNIARKFAEITLDVLRHEIAERSLFENFTDPLLIPMPVSAERKRERGWNQTEIVCEELVKLDSDALFVYSPNILIKHKHTESQARTHATKRERMENLQHSMSIQKGSESQIKARCIILIDDVTTSGSTFAEARRALKSAGARKVLCIALAH